MHALYEDRGAAANVVNEVPLKLNDCLITSLPPSMSSGQFSIHACKLRPKQDGGGGRVNGNDGGCRASDGVLSGVNTLPPAHA